MLITSSKLLNAAVRRTLIANNQIVNSDFIPETHEVAEWLKK